MAKGLRRYLILDRNCAFGLRQERKFGQAKIVNLQHGLSHRLWDDLDPVALLLSSRPV